MRGGGYLNTVCDLVKGIHYICVGEGMHVCKSILRTMHSPNPKCLTSTQELNRMRKLLVIHM
jgi:hypothetical protein